MLSSVKAPIPPATGSSHNSGTGDQYLRSAFFLQSTSLPSLLQTTVGSQVARVDDTRPTGTARQSWKAAARSERDIQVIGSDVNSDPRSHRLLPRSMVASPAYPEASCTKAIRYAANSSATGSGDSTTVSPESRNLLNLMGSASPPSPAQVGSYPSSRLSSYMHTHAGLLRDDTNSRGSSLESLSANGYDSVSSRPFLSHSPLAFKQRESAEPPLPLESRASSLGPSVSLPIAAASHHCVYAYGQSSGSYSPSYASAHAPYAPTHFTAGYRHYPSEHLPASTAGYANINYAAATGYTYPILPRPVDPHTYEARNVCRCGSCGSGGKTFSTHSNLLRHQREKSGTMRKVPCPHCGVMFTRPTARNTHVRGQKCRRRRSHSQIHHGRL